MTLKELEIQIQNIDNLNEKQLLKLIAICVSGIVFSLDNIQNDIRMM